jgi:rubrerythrin
MNFLKILDKIANEDLSFKQTSRAGALSDLTAFGKKAAAVAIPLGLAGAMSGNAKAQVATPAPTTGNPVTAKSALTDALQLALTLEYLEDDYYTKGLAMTNLIPTADRVIFQQILKHESAHVAFLKSTLTSLGVTPGAKPNFNYTLNGQFSPMTNYTQFLVLAQAFEDTGVRAYKGQAGNVMSSQAVLQAALQIHSVEARHASMVRRIRAQKGWIEGNDGGNMPSQTNAVYAGEEQTIQAGFNTATKFGAAAGSAAYDEILTTAQTTAIALMFIQ